MPESSSSKKRHANFWWKFWMIVHADYRRTVKNYFPRLNIPKKTAKNIPRVTRFRVPWWKISPSEDFLGYFQILESPEPRHSTLERILTKKCSVMIWNDMKRYDMKRYDMSDGWIMDWQLISLWRKRLMQDVSAYLHSYHLLGFAGRWILKTTSITLPPKLQSCMEGWSEAFFTKIFFGQKAPFLNIFCMSNQPRFLLKNDDSIATS